MKRMALMTLLPLALYGPATAQMMDHSSMPGMAMPATKPSTAAPPAQNKSHDDHHAKQRKVKPKAHKNAKTEAAGSKAVKSEKTETDMSSHDSHDGHDMSAMPGMSEANIPNIPGPPPPTDHIADRFFDPGTMAVARETLRGEHGGERVSLVMANILEYQARSSGEAGYRWEGEAWYGGDIDRFVFKTEGEGGRELEDAEIQGLYSHAIGPYFDLQVGLRHDFNAPSRTYATLGFEGLAPYWFDVGGALFLSNKGEVLGRFETTYDLRLTQTLILQPRAELNLSATDSAATQTGSGLSTAELGLRLRYEISREFAPYIGITYDTKLGKTADYARARGENTATTSFVVGVRMWF